MSKLKSNSKSGNANHYGGEDAESTPPAAAAEQSHDTGLATAATLGVVAVGALIFEAALLPGLILGAAAALAPSYLPKVGSALNPLFRSTVRGAYRLGQKSREAFAEAQEHFHDIAAEVDAEDVAKTKAAAAPEAKMDPAA